MVKNIIFCFNSFFSAAIGMPFIVLSLADNGLIFRSFSKQNKSGTPIRAFMLTAVVGC